MNHSEERYELYCIDFPNGKKYIGISYNARKRFMSHKRGAKKELGTPLAAAIRKYGSENIVMRILCVGLTSYIADLEIKTIAALKTRTHEFGYNISHGGDISPMKDPRSVEKMRKSLLQHFQDFPVTEEMKQKMKETLKPIFEDPEYLKKLSITSKRGWQERGGLSEEERKSRSKREKERLRDPSAYLRLVEQNRAWWAQKGEHSNKTRIKMSRSQKKRLRTPEEIARLGSYRGENNYQWKGPDEVVLCANPNCGQTFTRRPKRSPSIGKKQQRYCNAKCRDTDPILIATKAAKISKTLKEKFAVAKEGFKTQAR